MVTHSLQIGSWKLRVTPLVDVDRKYETVDKDGKPLEYIPGKLERGHYIDPETKQEVTKTYKLVNGKPQDKLKKTSCVEKFKEVDITEVYDLKTKHVYYVEDVPADMLNTLKNGKAIKIIYSTGNGFSVYYGYVFYSPRHNKILLNLGDTYISEQIAVVEGMRASNKKLDEVTIQDNVSRAKAEDMLEL